MIVMKFGGTSVQDAEAIERLIKIVGTRLSRKPIIVSSATAKTTDTLLECAKHSCEGNSEKAYDLLKGIKDRHIKIAKALIKNENSLAELTEKIKNLIDDLKDVVKGINLISELSPRSIAKVSSFGELLSTLIISYALNEKGISTDLIDARSFMISNNNFVNAEPDYNLITKKAEQVFAPVLTQGKVIVTQGFIASTPEGLTTTFSRGGSDYSASIIGMAMNAEEIEIWTDVDGILTADPRKVQGTKIIKEITFKEAAELAYFGAKVLHPSSILPAVEKNIPVRILNSNSPEKEGTIIKSRAESTDFVLNSGVKSITSKSNITILNIYSPKMLFAYGFLKKVFEVFNKFETSVDLVTTSEVNVSVTLDRTEKIEEVKKELSEFSEVSIEEDKALVCVVGSNLKYIPGVVKKVFSTIGDYNITMISQGASIINISFIIDDKDLNDVLKALHTEFFEKKVSAAEIITA
jgi:aspartate kinase